MEEIWKSIEGYEGIYQISNLGNVKSLYRLVKHKTGTRVINEKILKQGNSGGYLNVELANDGINTMCLVHRLVAKGFIPNPENKPCINHIDGNTFNNNINNLEWCTYSENNLHADNMGLRNIKGERHYKAILTDKEVLEIRSKYIPYKYSHAKLGKEYGVTASNIQYIITRKLWKHI